MENTVLGPDVVYSLSFANDLAMTHGNRCKSVDA